MRINALGNTATDFANDDYIALDGATNGSRKMAKATLLEKTAQNALAENVAQAFDPTRDNTNPYLAGESVVYNGKTYTFKVNHYGAWSDTDVVTSSAVMVGDFVKGVVSFGIDEASYVQSAYLENNGAITSNSSWVCYKYVGSIVGVNIKCYSNSNKPAIAFYSDENPSMSNLISVIKYTNGTNDPQFLFGEAPVGTKAVLICTRVATATDHIIEVAVKMSEVVKPINQRIKSLEFVKTADIDDAVSTDNYYYNNGWIASGSWTRYIFNISEENYERKVKCSLESNNAGLGAVIFLNSTNTIISHVDYSVWDYVQDFYLTIPSGTAKIAVCNRSASLANPTIEIYSDKLLVQKSEIKDFIKTSETGFKFAADINDADGKDNQYGDNAGNFNYSNSWTRYLFENKDYESVLVTTQITIAGNYVLLAFFDDSGSLISKINYQSQDLMTDKKFDIPLGTKKIVFCNRDASYISPQLKFLTKDMSFVYDVLVGANIASSVAGVIKFNGMNIPNYVVNVGNIERVASHFKLALVKDGEIQYYLNQTNILKDINGVFDSVIDGADGDVLIVNDVPLYMLIGSCDKYSVRLFSVSPFEFDGVAAMKIDVRGDAPSLCFVDNINDNNYDDHEDNLLTGKSHFVRNSSNVAYYLQQKHLDGKYVPTEIGGVITYSYDSDKHFIDSGAYRPSVYLNQNTAENAATNKNVSSVVYTNKDLKSIEIVLALAQAEAKTNNINSTSLFGMPFTSDSSFTPSESLFADGTLAGNGVRFKDSTNTWVYKKLQDEPFGGVAVDLTLNQLLTDWMSPWEIMEQHLVLSYAKTNSIAPNNWFVYNENEYKYLNVGSLNGLADGVMTAVIFKKFRCKIGAGVTHNGVSVAGNDIEYVILSSIYRGWVLDTSPHIWLTGINCIADDSNNYTLCYEFDYKRYLMDRDYQEIVSGELFDFEKKYSNRSSVLAITGNYTFSLQSSKNSASVPKTIGTSPLSDSIHQFECAIVEPDQKKASSGKKIVQGVKLGYGPQSTMCPRNYLYMNHPRTYSVARAGYCSFVCQNVK